MPMTVTGIREVAFALGEIPAEIKKVLKPAVLDAGEIVAAQMRQNASFSPWIAANVNVSASFGVRTAGARITVPERGFPHAGEVRTFEGNGVSPTPFRHPVYGNRNAWVSAMTHPFAGPAVEEKHDEATAVIAAAVETVIESTGL